MADVHRPKPAVTAAASGARQTSAPVCAAAAAAADRRRSECAEGSSGAEAEGCDEDEDDGADWAVLLDVIVAVELGGTKGAATAAAAEGGSRKLGIS